jgi:hypothetical protein
MQNLTCSFLLAALLGAAIWLQPSPLQGQLLPADTGTTVSGFQDDFDGAALNPNWAVRGASVYTLSGGMLRVTSTTGDPNHLLYELAGYNNSVQEVLARIRVTNFGSGDGPRAGVSAAVDTATSQGINLMFRDEPNPGQRHFEFLDDARVWGTELAFAWQNNTWYWLRLRHDPNAASLGGVNDVFGKIWLADGSQAEPAAWQFTYDYTPGRSARTGFAGLAATSAGGTAEFDVDYALIKAAGLPNIVVAPNTFVQTPVMITNHPQSQHVLQCSSVVFTVGYNGTPPFAFQWFKDGGTIPGGTNSSYSLTNAQFSDAGAYHAVVSNVASNTPYSAASSNATLTLSLDTSPPVLLGAANAGRDQILVTFSEPVTAATATNRFNYSITNASGSLPILSATLAATGSNVMVITTGQVEGVVYTLTVNNIMDQCEGNLIQPNSQAMFMAVAYTAATIGNPQPPGGATPAPGGLNVTAGGRDIGGTNDQFQFSYQSRAGDFDVKVRLDSLSLADAWSEAGLVAREDLGGGSRFASVMATPSVSGSYFQSRAAVNGAATLAGSFPVNYPNTWLRLRRAGNLFTGYAGFDGENWTMLGSATITMPATVSLGFAASSHNTNQTTTAAFRDFANVTSAGVSSGPLPVEPLGQSSRRTSLVISEIMFNPIDREDRRNLEFVELFNALGEPQDISGYRLDGAADFTFPPGTVLPAGGFLVVAQNPADVQLVYGLTGVLGPFSNTNSLPNDRGTVQLRHRTGAVFLEANYDTEAPWPIAADGAGHSLVLARPSYGEGNLEAWAASDAVGGSPGRLDPVTVSPLRDVVINEFLAHTDPPALDFIELYNHGNQPVDISGCFLSDDRNTNKFVIPANTVLPARGFASFNQTNLGFALSSGGERIYFRNGANSNVLDAARFEAQANGVSSGRHPDGAPGFSELVTPTPGTNNSVLLIRDLVINEIMYNPISRDSDDEFIELHNRGGVPMNLAGWRLTGGISFTFPPNASVPANGYLVIARNAARLLLRYPSLNAINTVGDFNGSLANGGERITLTMPDRSFTTNGNVITTNINYVVADEVTYRDGGQWGQWSDGGGSSLELIDARSDNRLAANWADSDETAKAPWTTVEVRGVLDNGTSAADQLQTFLQGAGECLIDDVEVRTMAGVNVVANSTFEGGATGWTAEGTQSQSVPEAGGGFNSTRSYRVIAVDRGDNQVNRIRTPLTAAQASGQTNTIRAKVRWLRGHPEILFRLRGNWHEAAVSMDLPTNLGTPGAANSRAVPNAPPAIYSVAHHPPVPAANEAVVVTARVYDPDGLTAVQLRHRLDPGTTLNTVAMRDDGTGGDAVAGDGLYSATLPGQSFGALVAFRVQATDGFSPGAAATFPKGASTNECLVRFGESVPSGNFPSYRLWMTQATFNAWDARNNLNNTMNDVTFVLGNHRVIYNAAAVYAGSPYIAPGFNTPTGNRCGYAVDFPADEPILGDNGLNLDWPGGHGNENTAVQEQMAYWIADQMNIAFSHRYFIRLTVNGVTDMQRGGVFEAAIQPGAEFLRQWSPGDSEGDFFRIDRAFEFNDAGGLIADPEPQLRVYSTPDLVNGGVKKKTEKYRWYWLKRAFESANDYTTVFAMADALNTASLDLYTSNTEALADVEQWMGIFAAEHIINNFDSWGHDIGKNMYMFFPKNGRSQLYMFDLDWLMLVAAGSYPPTSGPLFTSDDPTITRMYNHPPFRRAYFRAVQTAISNAFVTAKYEPVMDAKYASLVANGITLCDGQNLQPPTAVKTWFSQRRTFLVGQLNGVAAGFAITNNGGNDFTVNTNLITLSGAAPVGVKGIRVNGAEYPVTWTSVSNWTMRLALGAGQTSLVLEPYDPSGHVLSNLTDSISVTSTATPESPEGRLVINEIMYQPKASEAEFVEILNTSATTAFDLSGWRLNGLDYTFPPGSVINSGGLLVACKDRTAFGNAFGWSVPVLGTYGGQLDDGGETITLIQPGATSVEDVVMDRVTYDDDPPWIAAAAGQGASLQLVDARQDNSRVSNWSDGSGWQFFSFTRNVGASQLTNLAFFFQLPNLPGDLYLDDVSLVQGSQPEVGPNVLANGGFEEPFSPAWQVAGIAGNSVIVTDVSHSGAASAHVIFVPGVLGLTNFAQRFPALTPNTNYTLSFWYRSGANGTNFGFRLNNLFTSSLDPRPRLYSPGEPNSGTQVRPPYPPLWINELLPNNATGLADNAGDRDPWVEIYNAGTESVSLNGWHLSDNYTNLARWAFPPGAGIGPGQFLLVWLDGEPGEAGGLDEAGAGALHANFRISPTNGSVALVFPLHATPTVLDYLNYHLPAADQSLGFHPDGEPGPRQTFFFPTPGATNNAAAPPVQVFINEWMAANTGFIVDPTDGAFDDWFELYNPSPEVVDLTGYSLSDRLNGTGRWNIPAGTMIAARGFLFVWADEDTGQNATDPAALHAGFRLSQNGEAIGLYAPNGRLVDSVLFGAQTNNVSQGRWPDGSPAPFHYMPTPTPRASNVIPSANPPEISITFEPNNTVTLIWSSQAGRSYRVQYKDDLNTAEWTNLGAPVSATGPTAQAVDQNNGSQRFYQVTLIQ